MEDNEYDIFRATFCGDIAFVDNFISTGTNPNLVHKDGRALLIFAIEDEQIEMIKYLLNHGADVNFQNSGGWTPLHHAVDGAIDGTIQTEGTLGGEPLDVIKSLIDHGADVDLKDSRGCSPIDIAKQYHSVKVVNFLEEYKSNNT